ncbi:AAA family ATPase [Xanthomonadaceae bacterium XH05]|nr:AAA family ATPase [Xanthomonadaceae bacterium XH05]
MYLDFYGLREAPFSITPDPRFVFLSERHRDALAHLLYGIGQGGGGGFVQLTGEVGTGKTTLCRLLLEQLPENVRVALVLNPRLTPLELLQSIAEELGIDIGDRRDSLKRLVDALNGYLIDAYAKGLRVVLIVDEAQNLSFDALEQIRLLTNLETATQKLLQIILLGQPELRAMVAQPELRQLAQRITARYHLLPLDVEETEAYLRHRLGVAGSARFPFSRLAVRRLHQYSGGVPRLINTIADRALMAGYAKEQAQIGEHLVERAAAEVLASPLRRWRVARPAWVALALLLLATLAIWAWPSSRTMQPVEDAATDTPMPTPAGAEIETDSNPAPPIRLTDAGEGTQESAFRRLLALWKLRASQADVASAMRCPTTISPGVFCLRGSGNLAKLRALGKPVVLRLRVESRDAWAVLIGADGAHVRLGLDGNTLDVAHDEFEQHWLGEYFVLWRAPAFLSGTTLRRGDTGPGVEWLRRLLLDGGYAVLDPDGPALFDAQVEAGVRTLQNATGLVPDGIVGPETMLAVAGIDKGGPRLRRRLN